MEPFKLTPQSLTFVALMAGVALIVAVAAPFGSVALGVVALLALGLVLVKAMLRTRNWWPLNAVEGTIALSSLVLVIGGVAVTGYSIVRIGIGEPLRMMVGWPFIDPPRAGVSSRAVHYSDPDTRQRLKDELRAAGIPFTVRIEDGKEFVGWSGEHNAAAEAINEKMRDGPLPNGRNARFPDPALQKQFTDWLDKKGIKHQVVNGYVVWDEGGGNLVREFMESRASEDCKGKVAEGKSTRSPC